jgi:monoamine oxidase
MSRSMIARLHRKSGRSLDPVSRREWLKITAAAAGSLLLSNNVYARILGPGSRLGQKRVVVVGAGFAGLAAAYELKHGGFDVSVIEARDRVSGRVLSFSDLVKDKVMEGGGELIGSNHPTWVAYKEKFGLDFLDVTEEESAETPIVLDGKKLSREESDKLWEEMEPALRKMNADAEKVNVDEPWKTPDAEKLDKTTLAEWLKGQECSPACRKAIEAQLVADNGQAADRQSYLGMITQVAGGGVDKYWTESEVYRCKGGNQQLAMKLADGFGKDRITLKLAVTKIEQTSDKVVVTCADRRTLECDEVVLAVPPSVWSKISFSPDLPAALKPQMGANVKYLTALKNRFWKGKELAPVSLQNGDIGWTWEGTDNQEGDENAGLVAFSGGPGAVRTLEYPKDSRDEMYKKQMEAAFPGYSEAFVKSRYMSWPKEEWTNAGYSFPGPGQVTTVGPLMQKGVGHVHIAGEHACYKFVGYMEGALNSGVTVARRLAQREGVGK